jgi:hypothetical protein
MRTRYVPSHDRRILCVYPRYARSFGTFQHAYPFFGGRVRAFMPPQGLLVAAAYLPERWEVRFVDENSREATEDDFRWADAVFASGMHIQRARTAGPWSSAARPSRGAPSTIRTRTSSTWASWATPPIA